MITDLEELKKLAEAATPGPWGFRQYPGDDAEIYPTYEAPPSFGEWAALFIAKDTYEDEIPDRAVANASFIAAARSALPALIERVEAAEAEAKHLQSLNNDAHAIVDRIWAIFGTPSYEALAGRTIYDLVQDAVTRAEAAEAENARLREALGEAAEVVDLMDGDGVRSRLINAREDAEVKALCERVGYGAVMDSAARQWFQEDHIGAIVSGPCAGTIRRITKLIHSTLGRQS